MKYAGFKKACLQSTDFHFPDIDVQLAKIQECALIGNAERADVDINVSVCSTSSEDVVTPPGSTHGIAITRQAAVFVSFKALKD